MKKRKKEQNLQGDREFIYCLKKELSLHQTHSIFVIFLAPCHAVAFPSSSIRGNLHYSKRSKSTRDSTVCLMN